MLLPTTGAHRPSAAMESARSPPQRQRALFAAAQPAAYRSQVQRVCQVRSAIQACVVLLQKSMSAWQGQAPMPDCCECTTIPPNGRSMYLNWNKQSSAERRYQPLPQSLANLPSPLRHAFACCLDEVCLKPGRRWLRTQSQLSGGFYNVQPRDFSRSASRADGTDGTGPGVRLCAS